MIPGTTRRRVKVGDIRLAVHEAGEGPPVVLLHGFPELAYSWRHQIPALAEAGFHAVAPDLRGYGASDRPSAVDDYAAPKLVGDVAGLIEELGGTAHLVGHDWGGGIAWSTAALHPELVRSLSICNAPHPVASAEARQESEAQRAKSWYMLLFQFPGIAEAWFSTNDWAQLRRMVFENAAAGTFTDADVAVFIDAFSEDGAMTAALNYYRANMPPAAWLKAPPQLPPVAVPTMIIWGDGDTYLGDELLTRSRMKCAVEPRVETLPGVSHWVQQEAPAQVNAHLIDWLNQQP